MFFNQIKFLFRDAIFYVVSHMTPYLVDPDKDFTRRRKLPPEMLISFLVSQSASSTGNELDDFFDLSPDAPSLSALNQQRNKLRPKALEDSVSSTPLFPTWNPILPTGFWRLTVPLSLFSVLPSGLRMNILFLKAIPPKVSTVSTSMRSMTLIPIPIRTPLSSLFILKMNSGLSALWWTVWKHLTGLPIFL